MNSKTINDYKKWKESYIKETDKPCFKCVLDIDNPAILSKIKDISNSLKYESYATEFVCYSDDELVTSINIHLKNPFDSNLPAVKMIKIHGGAVYESYLKWDTYNNFQAVYVGDVEDKQIRRECRKLYKMITSDI